MQPNGQDTGGKKDGSSGLDSLGTRIEKAEAEIHGASPAFVAQVQRDSNMAWRVLADIISGPVAGLLIGYALDEWLGTSPLFILLCFFLGMAGGFLNAYRTAMRKTEEKKKL